MVGTRGGMLAIGASLALHLLAAAAFLAVRSPTGSADPLVLEVSLTREAPVPRRERPLMPARAPAASPPSPAVSSSAPQAPRTEPPVDGLASAPAAPGLHSPLPSPDAPPPQATFAAPVEAASSAYARQVWARIAARRPRGLPGARTARIGFRLDASGRLTTLRLVSSSGRPDFDRAALASVRAAAPFPPPPAGLDSTALDFEIPIRAGE